MATLMAWSKLLSRKRLGETFLETGEAEIPAQNRTSFQRDFDRIVFSSSFRRLKDKTQVFPLFNNDYVRNRLIHSLEASCVGRSLGTIVGEEIIKRHSNSLPDYIASDFGDIIAAACLAHDIGNPPFGHTGEDAIQEWFKSVRAQPVLQQLNLQQQADLTCFEGNAQGFRIITQKEKQADRIGMQLTYATLGTFMKYPRESLISGDIFSQYQGKSTAKHGFFQAEKNLVEQIATEVGLIRRDANSAWWCRHPLVFLIEAADDICYHIVDLEDGFRMGYITYEEAENLLMALLKEDNLEYLGSDLLDNIKYLRSKAIHQLILEVKHVFLDFESDILSGEFDAPLTSVIPSANNLKEIVDITRRKVYESCEVIEVKVAGYEVLGGLLEEFITAISQEQFSKSYLIKKLLPNFKADDENLDLYKKILKVTDYISGMTDSYAVSVYKKIKGISLPRGGK
ncbi:deoxyguanosinetriphosphate triphosphohydrolase [cyanobacterium TDX16]|nr:deoxyguanosinetriphosphate triphosphohydrolase [cyanobacterium TDX16]